MNQSSQSTITARDSSAKRAKPWQRVLPVLITLACFAYLYNSLNHAALAQGTALQM